MEDNRLSQNVEVLREWYQKQPHLPKAISEDYFLAFASGCKTLEDAKRKLDAFFSLRHEQVWFLDFEKLFARFKEQPGGDLFLLPGKTPEGWRVLMYSYHRVDINQPDYLVEAFKRTLSIEYLIRFHPRDVSFAFVIDCKGAGVGYVSKIDFPAEISTCKFLQSAMPLRVKKFMLLNSMPVIEKAISILKPFFPKKINERTVISSTLEPLKDHLPLSMLPKEYGGSAASVEELGSSWRKTLLAHEDWFRENSLLRSDESKRPKDSGPSLDCGTFRKLTID